MTNTTERLTENQELIQTRRAQAAAGYPALWAGLVSQWNTPGPDDRAWLMYAASYLFSTAGVRWAMDPLNLRCRIPEAPAVDAAAALRDLSFVVLTHRHTDHLDLDLLKDMRDHPARFIVPEFLLPLVQEQAGISASKIVVPEPLRPLDMGPVRLTPFEALHWEKDASRPDGLRGVPSLGYLVEFSGKRWLFPGDTRTYAAGQLPAFGPVDGLFAHLWLGRAQAPHAHPSWMKKFGEFCLALQPRRVVMTHIDDWSRPEEELWMSAHARLAVDWFAVHAPGLPAAYAVMGEDVAL
jgi:L-ascorbate metabolism protein UlaG (beta-lactamase superfamily)